MDEAAKTAKEVAGYLSVTEKTACRPVQKTQPPGFKVVGSSRFRPKDIEHWTRRQKPAVARGRGPA